MGLVAYYPLNGDAKDALGKYHGEANEHVQWVPGKLGLCPDTRTNNRWGEILIPHNEEMSRIFFGDSDNFAVSCIVNLREYFHYGIIWGKMSGNNWSNETAGLWVSSSGIRFNIGTSAGSNPPNSYQLSPVIQVPFNQDVVVYCEVKNSVMSVWVDGALHSTEEIASALVRKENSSPIRISSPRPNENEGVNGHVYDLRFYDQPLSVKEIKRLKLVPALVTSFRSPELSDAAMRHEYTVIGDCHYVPEEEAWVLPGGGSYLLTNYAPLFQGNNDSFTIRALVKPTNDIMDDGARLLGARSDNNGKPLISLFVSTSSIMTYLRGSNGQRQTCRLDRSLDPNKYHHITWVVDKGKQRLYLGGELVAVNNTTVAMPMSLADFPMTLGGMDVDGQHVPAEVGYLKELEIFHTAMDEETIAQDANTVASLDDRGNLHVPKLTVSEVIPAANWTRVTGTPFPVHKTTDIESALSSKKIIGTQQDNEVEYDFYVSEPGEYEIAGMIIAPNSTSDSFFMSLDGSDLERWDTGQPQTYTKRVWRTFVLAKGKHTLKVRTREAGTECSAWLIQKVDGGFVQPTFSSFGKDGYLTGGISEVGITKGLVGYWPLISDGLDYSGNNQDGVANNVLFTTRGFDGRGAAFFNGDNSFIAINNPKALPTGDITLSCWLWTDPEMEDRDVEKPHGDQGHLSLNLFSTGGNRGLRWRVWKDKANWLLINEAGEDHSYQVIAADPPTTRPDDPDVPDNWNPLEAADIVPGEWHHHAVTVNFTSKEAIFYLNGYVCGTGTFTLGGIHPSQKLLIGAYKEEEETFFGLIREMKVFDRVISPQEIAVEAKRKGKTKMTTHAGITYVQGEIKEFFHG